MDDLFHHMGQRFPTATDTPYEEDSNSTVVHSDDSSVCLHDRAGGAGGERCQSVTEESVTIQFVTEESVTEESVTVESVRPPPTPDASTLSMYISAKLSQRKCEEALALSALAHRDATLQVDSVLCGTMVSAFVAAGVPQSAVGVLRDLWETRGVTMDGDRYERLENVLWRGGFVGEAKEVQALMKKGLKQKLYTGRV